MGTVLIVDDVEDLRFSLSRIVKKEGHSVLTAASGGEALEAVRSSIIDLIFLDIGLPDGDGVNLIPRLREIAKGVDIVMLTGFDDAKTAVQALREGAVDYVVKPFDTLEFKTILRRIMQARLMAKQMQLDAKESGGTNIVGACKPMLRVKEQIATAAEVEAAVLITGETGTGKELAARAIHSSRPNRNGVFVKIDCGTLSASLIEDELFGHDRGAFTDAVADKKGLVEVANNGTLFLDEIGNLPASLQPKLLRLIEESTFRKVGGVKDIRVNVRIIAATNANIQQEIDSGNFREDLYYRLNVIPIQLPPLRERGDDILLLADSFLRALAMDLKKNVKGIAPSSRATMLAYNWPGNIRELRNLVERELLFCKKDWLTVTGLKPVESVTTNESTELMPLREMELLYIKRVLAATDNNKSKTARILGISRTTLRDKIK